MRNTIIKTIAAAGLAVAASAAPAAAAPAATPPASTDGRACDVFGICGDVHNSDDRMGFYITNDWPSRGNTSSWRWLSPGQGARDVGVRDADGLRVAPGCWATVAYVQTLGPGWHKVVDANEIFVTDYGC